MQGPTAGDAMSDAPPPGLDLRGDEVALYRDFAHELRRIVSRIVHTEPANVDDACQFAWLQLIRRQPRRQTVRAWLIAVARREAIRLHYVSRRHSSLDVGAVVGSLAEPAALVDEFEQALELAEALAALVGLSERKRRLYLLKVLGFSYDEIGAITGDSYSTVNRQLVRAGALIRRARGSH